MDMTVLRPDKALIFRIVHRDNLAWIIGNGLHAGKGARLDPGFVSIGDPDLIEKRRTRPVPREPGGTLGDYIPFYFTPRSVMLHNVLTGHRGIRRRDASEIIILISSLPRLEALSLAFLFTDRHASTGTARFERDLVHRDMIDWRILRGSDYRRDSDDPGKLERYQAEALVKGWMPFSALLGIGCHEDAVRDAVRKQVAGSGLKEGHVVTRRDWYPG